MLMKKKKMMTRNEDRVIAFTTPSSAKFVTSRKQLCPDSLFS